MPPPSFSSTSGLGALNVSRGTLGLVKDAAQAVHTAVLKGGAGTAEAARTAVHALLLDASLEVSAADEELLARAESDARRPPCAVRAAVAERLNVDLLDAFEHTRLAAPDACAAVVSMLTLLAPVLDVAMLRRDWWARALEPALQDAQLADADAARVRTLVVYGMLAGGDADDASLARCIFARYVDLARRMPELAPLPEDDEALADEARGPASDELQRQLEMIVAAYSVHEPTGFFRELAAALGTVATHGPVLYLLASFLHAQSMHTSRITATPLLERTVSCVLETHSTRAVSLGIKCLVMVLPHIPQYIVKGCAGGVPALLAVYGRAATWPRGSAEDALAPCVALFFTLLYGLFPSNVLAFLRAPSAYLGERVAVALDAGAVRAHGVPQLRRHAAHPLLAELDADAELVNTKRWAQQDASDLTATCVSLCTTPREELGSADALLAAHVPANATLLQIEHKFELYLKEQLLLHIGRLHRDRIAEAAVEAEHQSLYHTLRTLRTQLVATQTRAERQRAETLAANNRHVQWERELNGKLNAYREERRTWALEKQRLQKQLEDACTTNATQAAEITAMGTRLFELEQDVANARPKLDRLETYREHVQQLSNCMADWEEDLEKYERQSREMDKMLSWWEEMELTVANSEANANRYRRMLEQRTLEATQLRGELASLQARSQRQAERLAANQTWLLEAFVAPAHDSAEVPRITHAAPASPEDRDAALARRRRLDAQVLTLRARVEELEAELSARTRDAVADEAEVSGAPLFSPNTLRTPRESRGEEDSVPPLSLGSPVHRPTEPA